MKREPVDEAHRWLDQAESDLRAAEWSLEGGFAHTASFLSQQAAEKALKAFLYARGAREVLGHSTYELVERCAAVDDSFGGLGGDCAELDRHYLASRYPNALPGGIPYLVYTREKAQEVIACARRVIEKVKASLPG